MSSVILGWPTLVLNPSIICMAIEHNSSFKFMVCMVEYDTEHSITGYNQTTYWKPCKGKVLSI